MSHDSGTVPGLTMSTPVLAVVAAAGMLASYVLSALKWAIVGIGQGQHGILDHVGILIAQSAPPWWAPIALSASVAIATACMRLLDQRARIRDLVRAQRSDHSEIERLTGAVRDAEAECRRLEHLVRLGLYMDGTGDTDEWFEREAPL